MLGTLKGWVKAALERGAHDLHIKTSFPPIVRVADEIQRLDTLAPSPKEMDQLVASILDANGLALFKSHGQIDVSLELPGLCRVRANIFFQRNSLAISMRLVPARIPDMDKLGFTSDLLDTILKIDRGMVLLTGASNAGKSTTMSSIVNHLAGTEALHIITVEDPIEFKFPTYPKSIVSQRQVGTDTPSFQAGLISALRQDPDVILIGEIRDQETVETCLRAAETGHLVLGTLHTSTTVQSLLRLINLFPSHQRDSVRFMLASSLRLVISQMLLPASDRKGRVLAYEILPILPSVANLIRQRRIHEIEAILKVGRRSGCIPFVSSLKSLVKSERLRPEDVPQEYREEMKEG